MLTKCTFLIMLVLQVNWCRGAFQSVVLKESSLNTELLTDLEDIGPTLKIVKKRSPTESLNSTRVESVQEHSTITEPSSESTNKEPSSASTTIEKSSESSSIEPSASETNTTKLSSEGTSTKSISEPQGSQLSSEPSISKPSTETNSTETNSTETNSTKTSTETNSTNPSSEVTTTAQPTSNEQAKMEADGNPAILEEITANITDVVDDATKKETLSDTPESSSKDNADITNVGDKAIEVIQEIGKDILESVGNFSTVSFEWFTNLLHKGSELLTSDDQPAAGTSEVTETTKQT